LIVNLHNNYMIAQCDVQPLNKHNGFKPVTPTQHRASKSHLTSWKSSL